MTLAASLTAHYFDAARCLDDGVVTLNGEVVFSAHVEVQLGDVVQVVIEDVRKWTISETDCTPTVATRSAANVEGGSSPPMSD
jgi:type 1 fimbria pilin